VSEAARDYGVIQDPLMDAVIGGYGVTWIGDDGDMLILGHPERMRAAAIFLIHARRTASMGRDEIFGDDLDEAIGGIEQGWGRFQAHRPGCLWVAGQADSCERPVCDDSAWWVDGYSMQPGPGLLPVTILNAY